MASPSPSNGGASRRTWWLVGAAAVAGGAAFIATRSDVGDPSGRALGEPEAEAEPLEDEREELGAWGGWSSGLAPSFMCPELAELGIPLATCHAWLDDPPVLLEPDSLTGALQPLCGGACLDALGAPSDAEVSAAAAQAGLVLPPALPWAYTLSWAACLEGGFPPAVVQAVGGIDACLARDCAPLIEAARLAREAAEALRPAYVEAQAAFDAAQATLAEAERVAAEHLTLAKGHASALAALASKLYQAGVGAGQPANTVVPPDEFRKLVPVRPWVPWAVTQHPDYIAAERLLTTAWDDHLDAQMDVDKRKSDVIAARNAASQAFHDFAMAEKAAALAERLRDECLAAELSRWLCRARRAIDDGCPPTEGGQPPEGAERPPTDAAELPEGEGGAGEGGGKTPLPPGGGKTPPTGGGKPPTGGEEPPSACEEGAVRPSDIRDRATVTTTYAYGVVEIVPAKMRYPHAWDSQLLEDVMDALATALQIGDVVEDLMTGGLLDAGKDYVVDKILAEGDAAIESLTGWKNVLGDVKILRDAANGSGIGAVLAFYSRAVGEITTTLRAIAAGDQDVKQVDAGWFWFLGRWRATLTRELLIREQERCVGGTWQPEQILVAGNHQTMCDYLDPQDVAIRIHAADIMPKLAWRKPTAFIADALSWVLRHGYDKAPGAKTTVALDGDGQEVSLDRGWRLDKNPKGMALTVGPCGPDLDISRYVGDDMPDDLPTDLPID